MMQKIVLIIGAAGFVGSYLIRQAQSLDWRVAATKMPFEKMEVSGTDIFDLDIMDPDAISALLKKVRPDYIFHLAAQSSVSVSWKKPDLTVDVNIKGSIHVLNAIKELDYKPRVLLIGSGEEYGHVRTEDIPIKEDTLPRPGNLYAATKNCQNLIGKIYADGFGMDIMSTRSFNHIGPNQAPLFVVPDFCKQVAEIEKSDAPSGIIHVGNLSAKRDFTDVRDVVRAYCLLMERGKAGETYNVGSGTAVTIQSILDLIVGMAKKPIRVVVDPGKLRPVDVPIIEADISKLAACTGWKKEIPIKQTIRETLDRWRAEI